jgi:hypothetical protein
MDTIPGLMIAPPRADLHALAKTRGLTKNALVEAAGDPLNSPTCFDGKILESVAISSLSTATSNFRGEVSGKSQHVTRDAIKSRPTGFGLRNDGAISSIQMGSAPW